MMMRSREKPKLLEQTQKYCPFLDKSCIQEDCEVYSDVLGQCNLNLLTYNLYKLNRAIEKASKDITNRMY